MQFPYGPIIYFLVSELRQTNFSPRPMRFDRLALTAGEYHPVKVAEEQQGVAANELGICFLKIAKMLSSLKAISRIYFIIIYILLYILYIFFLFILLHYIYFISKYNNSHKGNIHFV